MILNHFGRQIGKKVQILSKLGIWLNPVTDISETYFITFVYSIILDTCSYIDEYDREFGVSTEDSFKARALMVKKITKPFISKIRKWKDLDSFRNNIVAHNLRNKGKFVFWDDISQYNIPRNIYDIYLLNNCIQFAQNYIHQEFNAEVKEGVDKIKNNINPSENLLSKDEVSSITIKLLKEAEEIAKTLLSSC